VIEKENTMEKSSEPEINQTKIVANHNQINSISLASSEQQIETSTKNVDKNMSGKGIDEKLEESDEKNSENKLSAVRDEKENACKSFSDDDMSENEFPEIVDCDPDE